MAEHGSLGSGAYRSVGEWLEAIKMGRYTEIFMENGYSSMDAVAQVTRASFAAGRQALGLGWVEVAEYRLNGENRGGASTGVINFL